MRMRLVTFQPREDPGSAERVGVLGGTNEITVLELPGTLLDLLNAEDAFAAARDTLGGRRSPLRSHALTDVILAAPLPRPNSFRDFMLVEQHVLGSLGAPVPEWYDIPAYWKGNCDTVIGPEVEVPWPFYTDRLDFELELAAVIGREARAVSVSDAADCIAGYTILNDWSARDIQVAEMKVGLGVGLSKDFATAMGPTLVTTDAFDPGTAVLSARINGETWSTGTLGSMLFSFQEVVSHLSQAQPLVPGDVIGSGTVAGGCGWELDRWVRPGDVVELEVEGIGVLRSTVGRKGSQPGSGSGIPSILKYINGPGGSEGSKEQLAHEVAAGRLGQSNDDG
jgi:2-keto-4-pentenoate hydratase/2-oxohepta-3-ene-1,7-dioic acid hydratase in catechol pathway